MFSASEQDTEHQAIAPVYMSVQNSNGHWGEPVPIDDFKISPASVFSTLPSRARIGWVDCVAREIARYSSEWRAKRQKNSDQVRELLKNYEIK